MVLLVVVPPQFGGRGCSCSCDGHWHSDHGSYGGHCSYAGQVAMVVMVANMAMAIMLGGHGSDLEDRNDRRVVVAQKPRVTAASPELV